jgi:hypothetical protein
VPPLGTFFRPRASHYDPMAERTRTAPCKVLHAWFDSKLGSPNARRAARLMPIPSTFDDEVLSDTAAAC